MKCYIAFKLWFHWSVIDIKIMEQNCNIFFVKIKNPNYSKETDLRRHENLLSDWFVSFYSLFFFFSLFVLVNMAWSHPSISQIKGIYFQNYKKVLQCTHFVDSIPLLFLPLEEDYTSNVTTLHFSHKIHLIVLNYKAIWEIPIFFWKNIFSRTVFP